MVDAPKPRRRRTPEAVTTPTPLVKARVRRRTIISDKTDDELRGGPYDKFIAGGTPPAAYIRVGISGVRDEVGFTTPAGPNGKRGAYAQNKDGTRKWLGWFTAFPDAHRAVTAAHKAPKPRSRKPV
jgi:hypothetical protein